MVLHLITNCNIRCMLFAPVASAAAVAHQPVTSGVAQDHEQQRRGCIDPGNDAACRS